MPRAKSWTPRAKRLTPISEKSGQKTDSQGAEEINRELIGMIDRNGSGLKL